MEIGMFTSDYQRYPLEEAFRDAVRFGYDYIELWGGRPHACPFDIEANQGKQILELTEIYQMPVKVYTPEHNAYPYNYMMGDSRQMRDSLDYIKQAMRAGKAIGAQYTLISVGHGGYGISQKELWRRLSGCLRELADYGEAIQHPLLLEPLTIFESNLCHRAMELGFLIDSIDSPYLMGMCDIVVPYTMREPVGEYFQQLGSKCRHIHFIDGDGISENHIIPGEGVMPLQGILEEIISAGYQGTMTLELVTGYLNEPAIAARKAIDYVRKLETEVYSKNQTDK